MGFDGLEAPARKSGANNQKITTLIEQIQRRHWPDGTPSKQHRGKNRNWQIKFAQAAKSFQMNDRATKDALLTSAYEEVE